MTRTSFFSRLRSAADVLQGAHSAARSIEAGRRPSRTALRQMGLSETAFDHLRLG